VRLVPEIALPAQAHVPATGSEPDLVPLELAKQFAPQVTLAAHWKENKTYLYGHDLMHAGYYWEAHEVWEAVWLLTRANSPERVLLQALIQSANAQLKRQMRRLRAAGKLEMQIEELRMDLVTRLGGLIEVYMGVAIKDRKLHYIA